jgi:DNA ligase-1
VYLTFGRCAAAHEGVELSVGGATVAAAVREVTGASKERVARMHDELGDLGDVAAALRRSQVTPPHPAHLHILLDPSP